MSANIQIIDGFVWSVIDADTAKEAFQTNEVFILNDDHSETMIETYHAFDTAIKQDQKLALEIGIESELTADWQEATERNNEKRSFMAWLEDKAENLIEN